jgi:hypothetical protein
MEVSKQAIGKYFIEVAGLTMGEKASTVASVGEKTQRLRLHQQVENVFTRS